MAKDPISIGDQFGSLTVDRFELRKKNHVLVAKCICGKEKVFWKKSAIKAQKSCGCLSDLSGITGKQRRSWNSRLQGYKNGALKRNLLWELSFQDFVDICSKPCYYCNEPPKTWDCVSNAPSVQLNTPNSVSEDYKIRFTGVDRYDSKKGYTKENCVPCCVYCNRAKSDLSFEDFKAHIERISQWLLQKPKDEK